VPFYEAGCLLAAVFRHPRIVGHAYCYMQLIG
jgi:hypothetical protein